MCIPLIVVLYVCILYFHAQGKSGIGYYLDEVQARQAARKSGASASKSNPNTPSNKGGNNNGRSNSSSGQKSGKKGF